MHPHVGTVTLSAEQAARCFRFHPDGRLEITENLLQDLCFSLAELPGFEATYGNDGSHPIRSNREVVGARYVLYCRQPRCPVKLNAHLRFADVRQGDAVPVIIRSGNTHHENHQGVIPIQLRGVRRRQAQEALAGVSAASFRDDAVLAVPHRFVPTLSSVQHARSEVLRAADRDEDPIIDMVKRSWDENGYVRKVTTSHATLTAFLGAPQQMEAFLVIRRRNNQLMRVFLDSTGGLTTPVAGKAVLQHVLLARQVIPPDAVATNLPVMEMLTNDQRADNIGDFLREFQRAAQAVNCPSPAVHEIVTDKSMANVLAISRTFNGMDTAGYLQFCYNVLEGKRELGDGVVIRLCTSHTCQTLRQDIARHYPNVDVRSRRVVANLVGRCLMINDWEMLKTYVCALLRVFFIKDRRLIQGPMAYLDRVRSAGDMEELVDLELPEPLPEEPNFVASDTIYRGSPVFQYFAVFVQDIEDEIDNNLPVPDENINQVFNPAFGDVFLKNHITYLPLSSQVMSAPRDPEPVRANNGAIEGYFKHLKDRFQDEFNSDASVRPGRYCDKAADIAAAAAVKIVEGIPARSRVNNKRRRPAAEGEETAADAGCSQENWNRRRSQPQRGRRPGAFFGTFPRPAARQVTPDS